MYKKIVVPVEMGQLEKGEKILAKAKSLLDAGGEIVLTSVAESVPAYVAVELPVDFIEQSMRILELAEKEKADLIIIGSHRPDFTNYLIGATADRVVRHAECSVLVDR